MPSRLRPSPRRRLGLLVALLPLTLTACGAEPTEASTWVGSAEGSDVVVALTYQDGAVRAYVCGGPATYATHSRWFDGSADEFGRFSTSQDGWTIAGELDLESATGRVFPPAGEALSFSMRSAEEDSVEGLYAVVDAGCRTGVVVQHDASGEPTAQGVWCDAQGRFAQVTPVTPIQRSERGIAIQVDLAPIGKGLRDLYVTPVPVR